MFNSPCHGEERQSPFPVMVRNDKVIFTVMVRRDKVPT